MYIYTSDKRPYQNVSARHWAEAIQKLREAGLISGRIVKTQDVGNVRRYTSRGEEFQILLLEA